MIKRNLLYYILILVFVLLTSVFVGARDLALGDTVNYIYFYDLAKVAFDSDHELAFYLLARLLNLFDLSYPYFLALCYFLTSYFLLNAFSNINGLKNSKLYLLYCLVFYFFVFVRLVLCRYCKRLKTRDRFIYLIFRYKLDKRERD